MPDAKTIWDAAGDVRTITQLANLISKNRRTVWLWVTKGVVVGTTVVKLQATRIGNQWVVAPWQYNQFVVDCNPDQQILPESPLQTKARFIREKQALTDRIG